LGVTVAGASVVNGSHKVENVVEGNTSSGGVLRSLVMTPLVGVVA